MAAFLTVRAVRSWRRAFFALIFGLAALTSVPALAGDAMIKTTAVAEPFEGARAVTWIDWQSGFRDSELRVGDRIVGVEGEPYTAEQIAKHRVVGGGSENSRWKALGKTIGDRVRLLVERDGRRFEVSGELRQAASYRNAEGKRILGPDGPVRGDKDGFEYNWQSWYSTFVREMAPILGWPLYVSFDSCQKSDWLKDLGFAERVAFLDLHYPGPFARAAAADWAAAEKILAGEPRTLPEGALEYRNLGKIRAEQVTVAADAASAAFRKEIEAELLAEIFPVPQSPLSDIASPAGKTVALPPTDEVIFESLVHPQTAFFHVGESGRGSYLVDRKTDKMHALYAAIDRYVNSVLPEFSDAEFTFFGRVAEVPVIAYDVRRNRSIYGHEVDLLAAVVEAVSGPETYRLFVDLRDAGADSTAPFAGEEALRAVGRQPTTPESTPQEVIEAFIDAVRFSDFETWNAAYRDWDIADWMGPEPILRASQPPNGREARSLWDTSRAALLTFIYDIEVVEIGPVRVVYQGPGLEAAAGEAVEIEEVVVTLQPVVRRQGAYRTAHIGGFRRNWRLQRFGGGMWKVADPWSLVKMSLDQTRAYQKRCES